MITIERNDYVQPTEVRDEVVKGICEAFLNNCCWSIYHPKEGSTKGCRLSTPFIVKHKDIKHGYYGFRPYIYDDEEGVKFNGAEMKEAFSVLKNAGYYIWKVREYGTWSGYIVTKKPCCNYDYAERVFGFDEFID